MEVFMNMQKIQVFVFFYYYIIKLFLLPAPLSSFHRDEHVGHIQVSVHQYTP